MDINKDLQTTTRLSGNVVLFYAFDLGEEIDLAKIRQQGLVMERSVPLSPYFKNYHIPLTFLMPEDPDQNQNEFLIDENDFIKNSSCISSKIHHFGVLSFCYKIPFKYSFEDLKLKILDIKRDFDIKSKIDAKNVFRLITPAIKKSRFFNLDNFYYMVQADPLDGVDPSEFKDKFGDNIASLLRLETQTLSEYQKEEILLTTTGYSGRDLLIIDSEASFLYDSEYYEALEFFEFGNIQLLELQYFDRLLDEKLNYFYSQQTYKVPLRAYIPLIGEKLNLPAAQLSKIRVEISVITERLENSIKLVGDSYYSNLYSIIIKQLSIKEWRDSISRKLNIMDNIYNVYQDRLDIIHDEILTIVVIILIAFEAFIAFMK